MSVKRQKKQNLPKKWPISKPQLRKKGIGNRLLIRRPRNSESKSSFARSVKKRRRPSNRRLKVASRSIFHHPLSLLKR